MGQIVQINVGSVHLAEYGSNFFIPSRHYLNPRLNKDDTYIAIYSPGQQEAFKRLKNDKAVKIIYESKKAYNLNMGEHLGPRNTVVMFELLDDGKGS